MVLKLINRSEQRAGLRFKKKGLKIIFPQKYSIWSVEIDRQGRNIIWGEIIWA